jgi:hypothetical protein
MFLDFTQARVEISKNSKWDESRQIHKEIQIPTAWSSSSITVRLNQGSFQNGETAYLYVIDENGNVNSQGYPVKFGGTASSSSSSSTSTTSSTTSSSTSNNTSTFIASTSLTEDYNSSSTIFAFEAEEGVIKNAMVTGNDNNSSAGSYIWAPSGTDGYSQYTFEVTSAGNYVVWGRVHAPSGGANSFLVSMDGKADSTWDVDLSDNWIWDKVNKRNGADPVVYSLAEGTHTLVIKQREDGTKLDGIVITKDKNSVPTAISENTYSTSSNQPPPPPGKPRVVE